MSEMIINEYTINSASKAELENMFNHLKSTSGLTDKEIYYYDLIDKRLSEIDGIDDIDMQNLSLDISESL